MMAERAGMSPKTFALRIPDAQIADLRERLARTRFPDEPPLEPGPPARASPI